MKLKQLFESGFPTSREEVQAILEKYRLHTRATINDDLSVDISLSVFLNDRGLNRMPVIFGVVHGDFYCQGNNLLTSLKGAPREVAGDFVCSYNELPSLQYGPREVGGNYKCDFNKLATLQGAPREVGENFTCEGNKLESLRGGPREVGGYFLCGNNQLASLIGAPSSVGKDFIVTNNKLTSLDGIGQVGGRIYSDLK